MFKDNFIEYLNYNSNNNIFINYKNYKDDIKYSYSIDGYIKEVSYEEIARIYSLNNLLNISADIKYKSSNCLYVKDRNEQGELIGEVDNNNYTKLSECNLFYYNNDKKFIISVAKNHIPFKYQQYDARNLKSSKVNNLDVILINYKNDYLAIFNKNDIYFYIEVENVESSELTDLLKSVI